jgi:pilus assembly protein FimV
MNRKLLRAVTAALLTVPGATMALGLGPIEVKSALDQPLLAEIPILAARPGEVDQLRANIASPDLFDRLGLEHPPVLSGILLRVAEAGGANPHILITSQYAMREPLLNLVVDVRWPGGRLLRDFAVFLDPPNMPRRTTTARPAATRAPSAPTGLSGDSYRVARGETLWSIASQTRPDTSVNVQQMVMALFRENPDAFYAPNINSLNAGASLRLPTREEILTMSASDAIAEVRQQLGLTAARSEIAESSPSAEAEQSDPSATDPATVADEPSRPALRLVEAERTAQSVGQEEVERPEISLPGNGEPTEEPLIRLEEDGLGLRLVGMDELNDRLPTLIGVEDVVLAARQVRDSLEESVSQSGEAVPSAEVPVPAAAETPEDIDPAKLSQDELGGEEIPLTDMGSEQAEPTVAASDGQAPTPAAEAETVLAPETTLPAEVPTEVASDPAAPSEALEDPTETSAVAELPASAPVETQVEGGLLERATRWLESARVRLLEDPRQIAIIGGGALLLVLLALVLLRRRGGREAEPRIAPTIAPSRATSPPMAPPSRSEEVSEARKALDEAHPEPSTAVASAASAAVSSRARVDNIKHADFLIAMGQYDDAADLVRGALQEQPERSELRVKLLECLRATGDREAFLKTAEAARVELREAGLWAEVQGLAAGFADRTALFAAHERGERSPGPHPEASAENLYQEASRQPQTTEEAATLTADNNEDLDSTIEAQLKKLDQEGLGETQEVEALSFDDFHWQEHSAGDKDRSDPLPGVEPTLMDQAAEGLDEDEQSFVETKLDLARAYLEMGDDSGARTLFEEVMEEGNEGQRESAKQALGRLG